MCLMDAAVYFDLSDLVELCAAHVAANFDAVVSFGQLLAPLVREIVARLSIGDLCICEYDYLRTEQSEHDDSRVQIDTAKFWLRAYAKIQGRSPILHSYASLQMPCESYFTRVRAACVRFYVEECLRRELGQEAEDKLARIVLKEQLAELCIAVTSATSRKQIEFWISLLKTMDRRPIIYITLEGLSPAIVDSFVTFCTMDMTLNICFKCMDTVHLSTLSIMRLQPGRCSSLPLPQPSPDPCRAPKQFPSLSTGWEPAPIGATPPIRHATEPASLHLSLPARHVGLTITSTKSGLSWQAVASLIEYFTLPHITNLALSGVVLSAMSYNMLATQVASATCTIQRLNLSHCNLRAAGIHQLTAALRTNCSLKHLNIAYNIPYDDVEAPDAARTLAATLAQQVGTTALEELVLAGNNLTTAGVISLCEALGKRPRIVRVDFSNMDLNASLKHLARALVTAGRTRPPSCTGAVVDISDTRILPRTFADFCAVLTALAAAANSDTPRPISCASGAPPHQHKQPLCISELNISRVQFNLDFATSLRTLLLPDSYVALRRLVLAGANDDPDCALGDAGCEVLLHALMNNVALRHLDLSTQRLSDAICAHLAALFTVNVTLEDVMLCGNYFSDKGAREMLSWFKKLPPRPCKVDLTGNYLTDHLARKVADTLWSAGGFILLAGPQRNIHQ
ncbi:hypothetical protein HDU86_000108 [Geranomyces michiganensis]|nr:hypothetical protein HDU86_000108 [Geranomyces michiganensis]